MLESNVCLILSFTVCSHVLCKENLISLNVFKFNNEETDVCS